MMDNAIKTGTCKEKQKFQWKAWNWTQIWQKDIIQQNYLVEHMFVQQW